MKATWALFVWTLRETLRDRILWGYAVFAVLMVLGLYAVGKVPWGETHVIVGKLGYAAIGVLSQILAALLVAFQLGRDTERRVHYMILGRGLSRRTYIFGRVWGLWVAGAVLAGALVVLLLVLNSVQASYRGPMWSLLGAVPAIALQVGVVLALSTLLYQITTSTTLAMVLALLSLGIGRSIASVQAMLEPFGEVPAFIGKVGAYVFPNLELLAFESFIIYEHAPSASEVATAVGYAGSYMVLMLALSILIFDRKQL